MNHHGSAVDLDEDADDLIDDLDASAPSVFNTPLTLTQTILFLTSAPANAYRLLVWRAPAVGNAWQAAAGWIGLVAVYPLFALAWPEENGLLYPPWVMLLIVAYISSFVSWLTKREYDSGASGFRCGGIVEVPVAFALTYFMDGFAGRGAGAFFAIGYSSSLLHLGLPKLRERIESWSADDTERALKPVKAGISTGKALTAKTGQVVADKAKTAWERRRARQEESAAISSTSSSTAAPRGFNFKQAVAANVAGRFVFSWLMGGLSIPMVFGMALKGCDVVHIAYGEARSINDSEEAEARLLEIIEKAERRKEAEVTPATPEDRWQRMARENQAKFERMLEDRRSTGGFQ